MESNGIDIESRNVTCAETTDELPTQQQKTEEAVVEKVGNYSFLIKLFYFYINFYLFYKQTKFRRKKPTTTKMETVLISKKTHNLVRNRTKSQPKMAKSSTVTEKILRIYLRLLSRHRPQRHFPSIILWNRRGHFGFFVHKRILKCLMLNYDKSPGP